MFVGIDMGTSSIKVLLINHEQVPVAAHSISLSIDRPAPGWSEQDPEDWWHAVCTAFDALKKNHPKELAAVKAIGLSGQMHGATLIGADGKSLRPCILWNDGRSASQAKALELAEPGFNSIGGNRLMPGFTAPKLQWVRENEPLVFEKIKKVLLPKDYVRFKLTGEYASDMSDSSGTLWLDIKKRAWCNSLLEATGLTAEHMPELAEGTDETGRLRPDLCQEWGFRSAPIVAGGASDNAAAACGIGAAQDGQGFVSLGTSGVVFVANDRFSPNVSGGVHAFCHALPETWHQMGVVLSAADSLNWLAGVLRRSASDLADEVGLISNPARSMFLPYLAGERTPHNDVDIRAGFLGLSHDSTETELVHAVMDGVAFALKDCLEALKRAGTQVDQLVAVGGGSRSIGWVRIIANAMGIPIHVLSGVNLGAALGAARLAMAASGASLAEVFSPPNTSRTIEPDRALSAHYQDAYGRWRRLYPALKETGF
ncbi:xylulokinase [Roseibium hamelinense]|uniref:Xylulose kinase n=1 Tax=Roseibium hamelinense TaxID=150831 RepID=A0A562T160_9HYPH|nr:xylulokinase [Roseibium hamelinense]MTI42046.1 xylulokinase [Roseibium hamelinense]TWI87359.1 xylulokinase [Roseibium hamelinense]